MSANAGSRGSPPCVVDVGRVVLQSGCGCGTAKILLHTSWLFQTLQTIIGSGDLEIAIFKR